MSQNSFIVRGTHYTPTVGLQASYDARVTFVLHPIQRVQPAARTDVPEFDRAIQRTGDDSSFVEL
uniref:Uncharacterized protein n=1 Tax=Romanomermis culicivorax TaxID=13658 RepID=A0A915KVI6_ROMCU